MMWTVAARSLAACTVVFPLLFAAPGAQAEPVVCNPLLRQCADNSVVGAHRGTDTTITGIGVVETIDCANSTLLVNGANNRITTLGTCWAVTMQGNGNIVVADNVINDITVYGWDQTVLYKNGNPLVLDRGRELGMTNRINRVPA
ncbi:DUF3060 domain-containing protein [Mycolicibacterium celeriflavum]|uniref:DUF3060 domain-containing protein n=1 Tax=Mycolicibacterium celeriflavum TaxID=1249101 RepID=UPI003CE7E433